MLGGAELVNGRVDFADRFVRPNYSAALSALEGRLGPYRSDADAMAELSLTGRVAGTGHLSLSGGLRPGAQPPVLDLRAQARDIELSPLSPYAGKYAGYGIERGKLAVDLRYRIEPDGRLQARNQLVLQQLTFGEAVDSPDATRLPVRLAVALLHEWVQNVNLRKHCYAVEAAMRAAVAARPNSVAISTSAKVPAISRNCSSSERAGSMNCGRKAAKNSKALGLLSADSRPSRNSDEPERAATCSGTSALSTAVEFVANAAQDRLAATIAGKDEDAATTHGTQKPVECMRRPMLNNSAPGDAVYEPFCGSGSTINVEVVLDVEPDRGRGESERDG